MKFSLSRTIRKILYRKKLYAVVVTQITIGMLILNIFSSLSLNIKSKLNTLLLENKNMEFYITAKYKDDDFFDPLNFDIMGWGEQEAKEYEYEHIPFDTMVLNILKDTFTDYDFELVATVDFHALTGNSMKTYTIYYSSLYDFVSISTSKYICFR